MSTTQNHEFESVSISVEPSFVALPALPYPFLSGPPPPQKKRPTLPLPSPPPVPVSPVLVQRCRSSSFITSWAATVTPGSPAPRSPHRRPSISSTYSRRRRPSIPHVRVPSGSFLNILDTPSTNTHRTTATIITGTPSVKDLTFDLTTLGYTSVFVHLPAPSTPSPAKFSDNIMAVPSSPTNINATKKSNSNSKKQSTLTRFRSLSVLNPIRTRTTNTTTTNNTSKPNPPSPTKSLSHAHAHHAQVVKRKKSKYATLKTKTKTQPPPLANELALMQFMDGGSMESHAKRVMEAQAKAAARSGFAAGGLEGGAGVGTGVGVGTVYRDGNGGMWWDQEEEWEYVHLLGEKGLAGVDGEWVRFDGKVGGGGGGGGEDKENENGNESGNENEALMIDDLAVGDERRGSVDSELDSRYVVRPLEDEEMAMVVVPDNHHHLHNINNNNSRTLLSIPSRPAKHLRRAPEFMREINISIPVSPITTRSKSSPTRSTYRSRSPIVGSFSHPHSHSHSHSYSKSHSKPRPKGKARRRPAPLNLGLNANAGVSVNTLLSPSPVIVGSAPSVSCDRERVRQDFIEDSFQPSLSLPLPTSPQSHRVGMGMHLASASTDSLAAVANAKLSVAVKAKPSRLGMRGLFKVF